MRYLDDRVYIDKVLAGEGQAFAMLVNKHKSLVFTLAYRILKNREDAEEVSQDTFLKAYHSLAAFKGDSKFTTWIYRIVYNTSMNKIRGRKKEVNYPEGISETDYDIADTENDLFKLQASERKKYLQEALAELDEEDAVIVTLFYMEDMPSAEISEITGLNDANVRVKLFRARKKMMQVLEQCLKHEVRALL